MTNPIPSTGRIFRAMFRMRARRLRRGRRVWLGVAAVALIDVAIAVTRFSVTDADPLELFRDGVTLGYFGLLVYLVPFLLCSGAVAEEVEGRTLSFLTTRPIPRGLLTMGQFAAGAAYAVALLALGTLALHLVVFATDATLLVDEFRSHPSQSRVPFPFGRPLLRGLLLLGNSGARSIRRGLGDLSRRVRVWLWHPAGPVPIRLDELLGTRARRDRPNRTVPRKRARSTAVGDADPDRV